MASSRVLPEPAPAGPLHGPDRSAGPDVVLIGYQDQGNLGMGYLAAVLQERGRTVDLIDVREGPQRIAARLAAAQPLVVGFSLIFQFFLPQFREVAAELRRAGVTSHFTIGGHYASLCHDELLPQMPELDSVARYEGEHTLAELVDRLAEGADWRSTPGLAFVRDGAVAESPPRALVQDLDTLPFPYRPHAPETIVGFPTAPLLASRGCARRCSFCSIHTFYRTAPGKVVRVRKAETVVEEMGLLHREQGVRVFLFQDDDFPLWGRAGRKWVDELAGRLHDTGLAERTIWKISCRAEYVEPELFAALREAGLFLVYMGIESGVESGLEILFKQMTVEQNLTGVRVLKDVGLLFSYGFMLFDPSSTFESVRANVGFLRQIVGDGSAAATFCRMLPYGGTPIRDRLKLEGRLRGDVTRPDYDFLDPRLNDYYHRLKAVSGHWVGDEGLSHELNWAWDEFETVGRLAPGLTGTGEYRRALADLTATANEELFGTIEASAAAFEGGDASLLDPEPGRTFCQDVRDRLLGLRNGFFLANVDALTEAIDLGAVRGPVLQPHVH
ncbi:radical SAM protein [Kitasatospora sp. CM 4170]|uniref:B12-binding domain-containing radical SAM protein n=1 Tax=Kitasatospora aburaviensis TaxID=67265 RepID=A0ABW1EV56_9ACTN|nr:radical SAM protein [Kitasatospora sp. CM 4170]WNM43682.1 radical SAM protein [Kitasatospora sp. CM 4170]